MICKNICHFFSTEGNPRSPSAPPFLGALVFHIFSNPHCPPPSLVQCPLPDIAFTSRRRMDFVQSAFAIANYTKLWLDNLLFPRKSWLAETTISCFLGEKLKRFIEKNSKWALDPTWKNNSNKHYITILHHNIDILYFILFSNQGWHIANADWKIFGLRNADCMIKSNHKIKTLFKGKMNHLALGGWNTQT